MKPDIEIICPSCSKKAAFYSSNIVQWTKIVPRKNGKIVCSSCGINKKYQFTSKDYYYSVPVKNRFLYARTLENLKTLLAYFKGNQRLKSDPELDFPKEFYENRLDIIKQIEKRIETELKVSSKI